MPNLSLQDQTTEFLLYTAPNGAIKVEVQLSNETIWLTQKRMAEQKAFSEYNKFNKQQHIESDFDREVKKLLQRKDADT